MYSVARYAGMTTLTSAFTVQCPCAHHPPTVFHCRIFARRMQPIESLFAQYPFCFCAGPIFRESAAVGCILASGPNSNLEILITAAPSTSKATDGKRSPRGLVACKVTA